MVQVFNEVYTWGKHFKAIILLKQKWLDKINLIKDKKINPHQTKP